MNTLKNKIYRGNFLSPHYRLKLASSTLLVIFFCFIFLFSLGYPLDAKLKPEKISEGNEVKVEYAPKDLRFQPEELFYDLVERYRDVLASDNYKDFIITRFCLSGSPLTFNYHILMMTPQDWQEPFMLGHKQKTFFWKKIRLVRAKQTATSYEYGNKTYKRDELQVLITDLAMDCFNFNDRVPVCYNVEIEDSPTLQECWDFLAVLHLFSNNRVGYIDPNKEKNKKRNPDMLDCNMKCNRQDVALFKRGFIAPCVFKGIRHADGKIEIESLNGQVVKVKLSLDLHQKDQNKAKVLGVCYAVSIDNTKDNLEYCDPKVIYDYSPEKETELLRALFIHCYAQCTLITEQKTLLLKSLPNDYHWEKSPAYTLHHKYNQELVMWILAEDSIPFSIRYPFVLELQNTVIKNSLKASDEYDKEWKRLGCPM